MPTAGPDLEEPIDPGECDSPPFGSATEVQVQAVDLRLQDGKRVVLSSDLLASMREILGRLE